MVNAAFTTDPEQRRMSPYQEPRKTWAGNGTGALCEVCGVAISSHDIEYEVELTTADNVRNLRFHLKCYRDWETQT